MVRTPGSLCPATGRSTSRTPGIRASEPSVRAEGRLLRHRLRRRLRAGSLRGDHACGSRARALARSKLAASQRAPIGAATSKFVGTRLLPQRYNRVPRFYEPPQGISRLRARHPVGQTRVAAGREGVATPGAGKARAVSSRRGDAKRALALPRAQPPDPTATRRTAGHEATPDRPTGVGLRRAERRDTDQDLSASGTRLHDRGQGRSDECDDYSPRKSSGLTVSRKSLNFSTTSSVSSTSCSNSIADSAITSSAAKIGAPERTARARDR